MELSTAIEYLNTLPRLKPMKNVTDEEWQRRDIPIRIVEQACQDIEYIEARNSLIPIAEAIANERVPYSPDDLKYSDKWTTVYMREMARLATPLLKGGGEMLAS